jgi:hypothetical protein
MASKYNSLKGAFFFFSGPEDWTHPWFSSQKSSLFREELDSISSLLGLENKIEAKHS